MINVVISDVFSFFNGGKSPGGGARPDPTPPVDPDGGTSAAPPGCKNTAGRV